MQVRQAYVYVLYNNQSQVVNEKNHLFSVVSGFFFFFFFLSH